MCSWLCSSAMRGITSIWTVINKSTPSFFRMWVIIFGVRMSLADGWCGSRWSLSVLLVGKTQVSNTHMMFWWTLMKLTKISMTQPSTKWPDEYLIFQPFHPCPTNDMRLDGPSYALYRHAPIWLLRRVPLGTFRHLAKCTAPAAIRSTLFLVSLALGRVCAQPGFER